MNFPDYGFTKKLNAGVSFDEAINRTTAALKEQGFGIITEINVTETFKKKLYLCVGCLKK